jgi:hypothetical protein
MTAAAAGSRASLGAGARSGAGATAAVAAPAGSAAPIVGGERSSNCKPCSMVFTLRHSLGNLLLQVIDKQPSTSSQRICRHSDRDGRRPPQHPDLQRVREPPGSGATLATEPPAIGSIHRCSQEIANAASIACCQDMCCIHACECHRSCRKQQH